MVEQRKRTGISYIEVLPPDTQNIRAGGCSSGWFVDFAARVLEAGIDDHHQAAVFGDAPVTWWAVNRF
jgi:hypothetical protein